MSDNIEQFSSRRRKEVLRKEVATKKSKFGELVGIAISFPKLRTQNLHIIGFLWFFIYSDCNSLSFLVVTIFSDFLLLGIGRV